MEPKKVSKKPWCCIIATKQVHGRPWKQIDLPEGTPSLPLKDLWEHSLFPTIDQLVAPGGKYEGYTVIFQEDNAGPHEGVAYSTWLEGEFT